MVYTIGYILFESIVRPPITIQAKEHLLGQIPETFRDFIIMISFD